nr:disease resistance protein [Quercus suber]
MDTLLDRSKEVKDDKEVIEKEGNKIRGQVIKWLDDVEKLQPRVNQILEKTVNNKNSSQCFLDCNKRYRKSRKWKKIHQEIKRLLEVGCFNSGMIYPIRVPRVVEHIPGPSIQEDFSIQISELVQYWLVEGLIDGPNYEDSIEGIALIEKLKDSCLWEDGNHKRTMKMHDTVRDVARSIASSSEDGCKSLVRSGIQLKPSTLLLQRNYLLDTITERFLQGFKALRVLNLSETRIRSLPHSLLLLRDLRALLLGSCRNLEEIPSLGMLSNLQELDLSGTRITELQREMENLSELRQLDLSKTFLLKSIQPGIISRCPINLGQGGGCAAPCDLQPNLEELRLCDMLDLKSISELAGHLGLRFRNLKSVDVDNYSQMKCLLYYGDFIQILPNLKVIKVSHCENLEELFNYDLGQNMAPDHVVPN